MTADSNHALRRDLETIFRSGTLAGLTDGQLLERLAPRRGGHEEGADSSAAFSILIERHGPMVLRVCRGVLGDPHEAEDAFQATFLVLLRQAGTIRKRESVGPWLHGVAHRVASCARSSASRRRAHERRYFERRRDEGRRDGPATSDPDLPATIHAELARLPERYRAPIVLCDLEEHSLDEAARRLGWPLGTIKSRLNRGRQRLRDRLARRGVAPAIAGLVLAGPDGMGTVDAEVGVSPALADATAKMMAGAGNLPASVPALVEAVGRMMVMTRMRLAAVIAIAMGLSAIGIGALAVRPRRGAGTEATTHAVATAPASQKTTAADKGQAAPARKKARPGVDSRPETITVSGRATDPAGRPVAGATVYVIDINERWPGDVTSRELATATTDLDGRYVARDVKLPVWEPDPNFLPVGPLSHQGKWLPVLRAHVEEGRFQVAATAPGFGFTWHRAAAFRPADRPLASGPKAVWPEWPEEFEAFYRGEPIALDLSFGPPASLHGRLTDDLGRPLANARVQVGLIDDDRREGGKRWSCRRVDPTESIPDEWRTFDGIHALPEALLSTRTGPDGSYRIDGLPREAQFLARIDPGPEFVPFMETIATTTASLGHVRSLGHDGALDRTFVSPHEVRFTIRYSDTKQPARGVTVRAMSDREMLRAGGVARTDEEGRAILRLRPGAYGYAIEPLPGDLHLPARGSFRVGMESDVDVGALSLDPAAVVTMEARDAKTGAGIEGVRFQYETDEGVLRFQYDTDWNSRRQELRSPFVTVDHPETDEQGRLRAILEPGRKRFFVGTVPSGWKLEGAARRPFIPVAGRELTIRWTFTRVEDSKAAAGPGPAPFPDDLVETWRRQRDRALPGKFRIRHYLYDVGDDPIPTDELEAFLDANDLAKAPDPARALEDRFPKMPEARPGFYEIIDDGRRRRNNYGFGAGSRTGNILVSNGGEVVAYDSFNGQSDIFEAGGGAAMKVFGLHDICAWPAVPARGLPSGPAIGAIRRSESGGRLTVERATDGFTERWVVDRQTGFVHADSMRSTRKGLVGQIVRQYGPTAHRDGVVLPTVHVHADLVDVKMNSVALTIIDEVDLDYRPAPLDFTVAAPAGTMILDHREDRSHPRQGMAHYPVADVLAYADGMSPRNRSIEPVKAGQPAPPIQPASWLDRAGRTDPPDVAGKVVLVHFWAISCFGCRTELPEVQAAADHFADKGKALVIIGLHEIGATPGQVAEHARERGLTYRLAVDRPAAEDGWFGATFRDYGVRGTHAAAVIDRKGQVAFVGRFPQALQEAAKLLGP